MYLYILLFFIYLCRKNVIINENFRCILLDICDALYEPFQSEPMLITDEYIDEERELEIARPKRKFMPDEIDEDMDRNKRSKFTDEEKSEPVKAVIRLPLANIAPVLEEINSVSAKPDLDKLKKAHIKLQQHPLSPPFLYPVDVTLYPDYSILVSEPMDLSTSKLKINRNRYKTVDEWASDIYLIFSNCSKYNREDSAIVAQSKILLEYFNNILLPFVKGEIEDIPEENCVLAGQSSDEHDITLMEYAKAHEMVAKFTLHPNAYFFSVPVDPQRDGAPDYFDIIKYPMDFGTIQKKLNQRAYSNINEFENDVRLVFNNCYTYNKSSKTVVYQTAKALERLWEREWFRFKVQNNMDQPNDIVTPPQIEEPQEASESDCLFAEKESLLSLTDKIMASPYAFPFLQPVDWKALCLFDYPRVIKMPMDLGTIRSKIVGDLYKKLEEFELDMCLVFENCFKYNSKGSSVYASAKSLQLEFRMYWDRFRHGERDFRSLICERPVEGDVLSLRRFLHGIRQKLVEHPSSLWFRLPVDPVAQNVPTYFDVITHPMDLHTLGMKIQSGTYDYDAGKYASDVRLIFQNCYKFNGVDSGPSQEAKMLEEYFDSIWNEFENKG